MIFLDDVVPLVIWIDPFGSPRLFASTLITTLLALPFSGGAFTFTLRVSSSQPVMQSFDEQGMTFILSFIEPLLAFDFCFYCPRPLV